MKARPNQIISLGIAVLLGMFIGARFFADSDELAHRDLKFPVEPVGQLADDKSTSLPVPVPIQETGRSGAKTPQTRPPGSDGPSPEDPKEPPHNWSNDELGLDLDRPWDEINMFEYSMGFDEGFVALELTEDQVLERRRRFLKVWHQDPEYWNKRHDLLALEAGLKALTDQNTSLGMIRSRVGLAMSIVSYWIFLQGGALWSMEEQIPARSDGRTYDFTGAIVIPSGTFQYGYMRHSFPVIEDWNSYVASVAGLAKDNLELPPTTFAGELRWQLVDAFEYAITQQRTSVPPPSGAGQDQ